ncbi:MAG: peptidoglycan editing factor PgeF [Alphaproteobacteria bacterium]|nr:peptidoglycan editing factor PgeF [Alphaproteobacteria bacterium]
MTVPLTAENLAALPHVRHAFFTRDQGNGGFSGQEDKSDVVPIRARMAAHLGVAPQNLLSGYQVHSPDVVTVTDIWQPEDRPRCDALVTGRRGVALGVLTADCVPVLFAGEGVVGAAHAGWRGAVGGVLENTLAAMEKLGARRDAVHTALGPCIWQGSYEVGSEFPAPFLAENPCNEAFFRVSSRDGRYMFDLPGYVAEKLRQLGVGSVAMSPADTCAAPERFFSHRYSTLRGEKRSGNLMSAIALAG